MPSWHRAISKSHYYLQKPRSNLTRSGATYCELGCGYGLTTLILAASNPQMSFVGVDFNPTHIVAANGRSLIRADRERSVHRSQL